MRGLIVKDLLILKNSLKTFLVVLIIYGCMIYMGTLDIFFLPPFLSMLMMVSTFNYDNYNKWDFYALTLPKGRKNIVRGKYITTLLVVAITMILVLIIGLCFLKRADYLESLQTSLYTFLGISFVIAILYPLIFKYGIEKARIVIFALIFGLVLIGWIIIKFVDFSFLNNLNNLDFLVNYINYLVLIVIFIVLFISYKISVIIFNRREL